MFYFFIILFFEFLVLLFIFQCAKSLIRHWHKMKYKYKTRYQNDFTRKD